MKKRYDFSKSAKKPYLRKPKKQLTIRRDEYFRGLAEKNGIPYQNLINLYLRDCATARLRDCATARLRDFAESGRKLSMKWD